MTRPTLKTPELTKGILDMAMAGETLTAISLKKGMPNRRTIQRWLRDDPLFYRAYKRALSLAAQHALQDILYLADRPKETVKDVAADRLRVNARIRLASLLNPALKAKRGKKKKDKPGDEMPDELRMIFVGGENDSNPDYEQDGNDQESLI
jgi:hypothetical protein